MLRPSIVKPLTTAAIILAAVASHAEAANPFSSLAGSWRGEGQVELTGGKTEKVSCKAYYTLKQDGAELGLALTCASASSKIELRAGVIDAGGRLSGTWEERAYNSTGTIAGEASDAAMKLKITGTLSADMDVSVDKKTHKVQIATDGTGFKSVDLELTRV